MRTEATAIRAVAESLARRRILGDRDEERTRATGLDRERFFQSGLREDRDAQSMQSLAALLPFGPTDRAHEDTLGHGFTVREKDLRATALDLRLMSIRGCEVRERRLRSDARAALEDATVAATIRVGSALHPLRRALRAAERAIRFVEAAPLDDPVLAAVREDHALGHHLRSTFTHRRATTAGSP